MSWVLFTSQWLISPIDSLAYVFVSYVQTASHSPYSIRVCADVLLNGGGVDWIGIEEAQCFVMHAELALFHKFPSRYCDISSCIHQVDDHGRYFVLQNTIRATWKTWSYMNLFLQYVISCRILSFITVYSSFLYNSFLKRILKVLQSFIVELQNIASSFTDKNCYVSLSGNNTVKKILSETLINLTNLSRISPYGQQDEPPKKSQLRTFLRN